MRTARLRHVTDAHPGIRRLGTPPRFRYVDDSGRRIADAAVLARIRALVIPPAWTDVWICPDANGHVQATGRDARGRKQHRYHPSWIASRDHAKYSRILEFAEALPGLRAQVAHDLRSTSLSRSRVLATVVALLEKTLIRVGNDEYAKTNRSFGLSTFLDRHVEVSSNQMRFRFRGKSGKSHDVSLWDPRLARVVKRCRDLPGSQLFQYRDERGRVRDIGSGDVNRYVRDATADEFSAKDFRTWAATVLAAEALAAMPPAESKSRRERHIVAAVDKVASRLGNTRAICRRSYIHPAVLDAYTDGTLRARLRPGSGSTSRRSGLNATEAAVLSLLKRRLRPQPAQTRIAA